MLVRGATAHEVRPAYLELRQTAAETYDLVFKVPALGEGLRLALYVHLPAGGCRPLRGLMLILPYPRRAGLQVAIVILTMDMIRRGRR
jgi:hypothetical protein